MAVAVKIIIVLKQIVQQISDNNSNVNNKDNS